MYGITVLTYYGVERHGSDSVRVSHPICTILLTGLEGDFGGYLCIPYYIFVLFLLASRIYTVTDKFCMDKGNENEALK